MATQVITHRYQPRSYFKGFHERKQRHAMMIVHRRGGKTVAVVNDMVARALRTLKPRWFGAYVAPFMGQAKRIAWAYLKDSVRDIPGCKIHESDTSITFANGAVIRVFGADNADALRGLYFDLVVLDEMADIPRRVITEIIRPALADRKGSMIIIGTPKGKNAFYEAWQKALKKPDGWFTLHLTHEDTNIIPAQEIEEIREDLDEAEFNQEFMCSFEAALRGAYYQRQLLELEAKGQVCSVEYDPMTRVCAAMDVGHADATSIWFWQVIDGWINVIDYFESTQLDASETCDILDLRPYAYEAVWLPHDAFHKTWQSKKSGFDTFRDREIPARRSPTPDAGNRVYHGIDAVRKVLRTYPIRFDRERCAAGIEALRNYSRKYNVDKQVFSDTPQHDRWSHGADAFRYACLAINPSDIGRSKEMSRQAVDAVSRPIGASSLNRPNVKPITLNELLDHHSTVTRARARTAGKVTY